MIVRTHELAGLRAGVVMVDGGFDPIHPGHVAYLREAAGIGPPVLCNVSPNDWIERKHPPLLTQDERVAVIDAIRYVEYTHPASTTTVEVLQLLSPSHYAKGADWRGRLPPDEIETCDRLGIQIVFLDTVIQSSSAILRRFKERLDHGLRD